MELETLPEKKQTEIGSYFVANYPPFSVWSPEHRAAVETALNSPPKPGTRLGLYLHIPFCRKRCKFCYFRVYTDKNADEIETYLDALSQEISLYAGAEGFGNRQFEFVYFGGGTPSYLSNAQLERAHRPHQRKLDVGSRPRKSLSSASRARSRSPSSRQSRRSASPASAWASRISTTRSSPSTVGPIARLRLPGHTPGRVKSDSRRSTSI